MKFKTLLSCVMSFFTLSLAAQQSGKISGFAITGPNKGDRGWKQVRLVDMKSGAEQKLVYSPSETTEVLDYRTGKAIEKKEPAPGTVKVITNGTVQTYSIAELDKNIKNLPGNISINRNGDISGGNTRITVNQSTTTGADNKTENKTYTRTVIYTGGSQYDQPFATTSAAAAYDKKHQRLYYTPMGIAELRFIDLKAKKPTVYYFQNEKFGAVEGMHDGGNQITRMVIGADGDGYALSNNANHLVKFTTGKKPQITDLGELADDASNGRFSVHSSGAYGGDMVAGNSGNLYLLTASRHVFKINIEQKTALHLGVIKGLPAGFQTNGAMVEEGMNIIVASSESTEGYYMFDLNTLQSQKYTTEGPVYSASDLAGSNLLDDKKSKKEEKKDIVEQPVAPEESKTIAPVTPALTGKAINVYPNPVTNGEVKVSFNTLPAGRYMIQLADMNGQVITTSDVVVGSKNQVETLRLPALISKGSYLVKVQASGGRDVYTETIIVQ